MAALSRVDSFGKDFPPFYLYIDEFQNVTTDSISVILSEARKYKLSLCVAHQFIAQLQPNIKDAVFGNVGTIVSYRVSAEDAKFLETQFAPRFNQKDIMNIENYNYYIKMLNNGVPVEPFNVRNVPYVERDMSRVEDIKQLSYLKYGKDRSEVEGEILAKMQKKG
jgi:type IV secretory pathway TraG/TraD family ATPase VirD4